MNVISRNRIAAVGLVLFLSLFYPAWQSGKWIANHFWAAVTESVGEQVKPVTLVVGPMLPINVGSKTAYALGSDVCPGQQSDAMRLVFGEPINAGMHQCIVVTATTTKVRVSLLVNGALVTTEEWVVERDAGRVSFRRPDGSPVVAAEAVTLR